MDYPLFFCHHWPGKVVKYFLKIQHRNPDTDTTVHYSILHVLVPLARPLSAYVHPYCTLPGLAWSGLGHLESIDSRGTEGERSSQDCQWLWMTSEVLLVLHTSTKCWGGGGGGRRRQRGGVLCRRRRRSAITCTPASVRRRRFVDVFVTWLFVFKVLITVNR